MKKCMLCVMKYASATNAIDDPPVPIDYMTLGAVIGRVSVHGRVIFLCRNCRQDFRVNLDAIAEVFKDDGGQDCADAAREAEILALYPELAEN